jgi:hypothetical protein
MTELSCVQRILISHILTSVRRAVSWCAILVRYEAAQFVCHYRRCGLHEWMLILRRIGVWQDRQRHLRLRDSPETLGLRKPPLCPRRSCFDCKGFHHTVRNLSDHHFRIIRIHRLANIRLRSLRCRNECWLRFHVQAVPRVCRNHLSLPGTLGCTLLRIRRSQFWMQSPTGFRRMRLDLMMCTPRFFLHWFVYIARSFLLGTLSSNMTGLVTCVAPLVVGTISFWICKARTCTGNSLFSGFTVLIRTPTLHVPCTSAIVTRNCRTLP